MELEKIDSAIYSYLEGTAQESDLTELLNWIKQNKDNLGYFNQICRVWENSTNIVKHEDEAEIALKRLNQRIKLNKEEDNTLLIDEDRSRFIFLKFAAVAIILIGFSFFFYLALNKKEKIAVAAYVTAIAPKSQKSQLILADGTKVWLNSGTTLKYKTDYGKTDRQIYLNGEAYFEVAKNPSKPFLVYASNIVVKAIGTSFNVKCYPEDNTIEATLVEGKVQVSESNSKQVKSPLMLYPNQRAIYNRIDMKLTVDEIGKKDKKPDDVNTREEPALIIPKTIASIISWKDQELIFENESFEELVTRLERWYNVEIKVLDSSVNNNNSYTGKFVNNESLDQVLKIISRTTPIKYRFRNGEVIIQDRTK